MEYILDNQIIQNLVNGRYLGDPFAVLGMHQALGSDGNAFIFIRTMQPQAKMVEVVDPIKGQTLGVMDKIDEKGLFQLAFKDKEDFFNYRLKITLFDDTQYIMDDPYRFLPVLGDLDLYLYNEGTHYKSYERLGAHLIKHQDEDGVSFDVREPNAKRVSVVGNFNNWDGRRHLMRPRGSSGVWELFIPGLKEWDIYKYELIGANGDL